MADAPFHINQGQSKLGRDQVEIAVRTAEHFARMEAQRQAMHEQRDKPTGTLSVRSDDTSGQVTLTSGHGIITGQLFSLDWSGGGRAFCVAGTVDGDNVPFSAHPVNGAGNVLPAQDTPVTATYYLTVANTFKFHTGDGTTIDRDTAYRAVKEVESYCGTCRDTTNQMAARFRQ